MMHQVSVILGSRIQEGMDGAELSARLAIQIAIGLMNENEECDELRELVEKARLLGLTGAEIGVAKGGGSFDVRDAEAMALSRAYRDGSLDAISFHERKAIDAGLSEDQVRLIKRLVEAHILRRDH